MAESKLSVYVQLSGEEQKSLAGEFTWNAETAVGSFVYEDSYLKQSGYLLDPVVLKPRPRKEVRNNGIYGVFRDAGPDAWGRDQLTHIHGMLDEISVLQNAPEDGAGNITFHPDHRLHAYTLKEIDDVSKGFPPSDTVISNAVNPTTSMGGAKPKLLAYDDGAFWIAKFPEKGDPEFKNAANEHAMLSMADQCGINACESRVHQLPDGRLIILVKRFDLSGNLEHFTRFGFASAHTVLGMGDPRKDSGLKSYPLLGHQARLWTRKDLGAELWQRLVFNALVSNTDDHARNHALIYDGQWSLSKAFDIVAAPGAGPVRLCLQIHTGSVIATPASLLISADEMGVAREQAIETIRSMTSLILEQWRDRIGGQMSAKVIDQLASAFRLADEVRSFDFSTVPATRQTRRYKPT
ncbi:MAG: HipA domain protein [Candidatus Gallionella acididurans]|uniref:HipA domain protein n=1 Tax=Candidatus Gallionella acididurans TaxID=1796491 RepID=A0A139BTH2_9PROT|nr:MAG: HipA domain protein [Candidatus Gallionella acididurans]